jgi:hypothetical protein
MHANDMNLHMLICNSSITDTAIIVYLLQGAEDREHVCRQRLQHVVVKIKGSVGRRRRLDILVPKVGYFSTY